MKSVSIFTFTLVFLILTPLQFAFGASDGDEFHPNQGPSNSEQGSLTATRISVLQPRSYTIQRGSRSGLEALQFTKTENGSTKHFEFVRLDRAARTLRGASQQCEELAPKGTWELPSPSWLADSEPYFVSSSTLRDFFPYFGITWFRWFINEPNAYRSEFYWQNERVTFHGVDDLNVPYFRPGRLIWAQAEGHSDRATVFTGDVRNRQETQFHANQWVTHSEVMSILERIHPNLDTREYTNNFYSGEIDRQQHLIDTQSRRVLELQRQVDQAHFLNRNRARTDLARANDRLTSLIGSLADFRRQYPESHPERLTRLEAATRNPGSYQRIRQALANGFPVTCIREIEN